MSNPDPFVIPEILACIAKFLTRGQAATCMRVCKAWTPEFERATWRSVEFSDDPFPVFPQPSLELLKQNAHHIRRLDYTYSDDDDAAATALLLRCPHLQTVHFHDEGGDPWDVFSQMIEHLPSLYKIELEGGDSTLVVPEKFLKAMLTCPKLVVLETTGLMIYKQSEEYFRTIAPRMRRVATREDAYLVRKSEWAADILFPELRYLDLRSTVGLEDELEWIVRCPNLISLGWEVPDLPMPIDEFCSRVPVACPHLTCFELFLGMPDEFIARIMDAIPRIEKFTVAKSDFGTKSIVALRRHFPTLKDFNIQYNVSRSSKMVQEILSSCPNLLSLCADEIYYEDLIKQPWVCRDLRLLDVGIRTSDSRTQQKEIYKRLAGLKELEWLCIGGFELEIDGEHMDLTLAAGLDALKSLTKLETFNGKGVLGPAIESKGYECVGWMLENWTRLQTLEGHIREDHPASDKIRGALDERGIKYIEEEDEEEELDSELGYDDYYDFDDFDEFGGYYSDVGHVFGGPHSFDYGFDYDDDDDDEEDEWTDDE